MSEPRARGRKPGEAWWDSLMLGGLFLSPAQARSLDGEAASLPELSFWASSQLRKACLAQADDWREAPGPLLDALWGPVLGKGPEGWERSPDGSWSLQSMTGRTIKPWRVYAEAAPGGIVLPVFLADKEERGPGRSLGRNRRFLARVLEWQRKKGYGFALATNGFQWRLIHAGPDYESFAEWDSSLWFEEGRAGPQIDAFRLLFGNLARTYELAAAAKAGSSELSRDLGERIRRAVEELADAAGGRFDELGATEEGRRGVYLAALRLVMRLIVILFAEARDLLPRMIPAYAESYSLEGLRDQLHRRLGRRDGNLRTGRSAWPRILALFRLVYEGSGHPALPLTAYGGGLFEPGNPASAEPASRAMAAFEDPTRPLSDADTARLLELLSYATYRTRQGRGSIAVRAPVDFSDLSSEYIGILYEGLLDFELRRTEAGEPVLFLAAGDEPALPLSRLEAMEDKELAALYKNLAQEAKKAAAGSGEDEPGEADEEGPEEEAENEEEGEAEAEPALEEEAPPEAAPRPERSEEDLAAERIRGWKLRAAAALAKARRGKESEAAYHERLVAAAGKVAAREILPGQWYLVRWGGTRKGQGSFYTPPGLVEPTVRRALEPLLYETAGGKRRVRSPEAILELKIADIAMGSGSFLIGALRELCGALVESLYVHGRILGREEGSVCRLADGGPAGIVDDPIPLPPEHQDFEARLRARLKRHVVERCLYGVDLDPLAVELARLALWVETMDYELPFTFLDHKLKVGNSLVGCRFAWLGHYPLNAFSREGPDKAHPWTAAYKEFLNGRVKPELLTWIDAKKGDVLAFEGYSIHRGEIRQKAFDSFSRLHTCKVSASEERRKIYTELIESPEYSQLRRELDAWCALWFWPGERVGEAPGPGSWQKLSDAQQKTIDAITRKERFFHWELEFPDVFTGPGSGFDTILGNPPWDTLQPVSKEYFSNIDPLFRVYGKQDALRRQKELFAGASVEEIAWDEYRDHFKAIGNWCASIRNPWGDPSIDREMAMGLTGKNRELSELYHERWRLLRAKPLVLGDPQSLGPLQGPGKYYLHKLFIEQAWLLGQAGCRLGLVLPGSLYSDNGSGELRRMLLDEGSWDWLFGFENRDKIFDIDSRFRFCTTVVAKGGRTEALRVSFMNRRLASWAEGATELMSVAQVKRFSPKTGAFLEVRGKKDIAILEKLYANPQVALLGDASERSWKISYRQGDFNMTSDSARFPPIAKWEAKGYRADEYGHWLTGPWEAYAGPDAEPGRPSDPRRRRPGTVLSQDRRAFLDLDRLEGVALPLYQGVMIGHFDYAAKSYVSGAGNRAQWAEQGPGGRIIRPQFLMDQKDYESKAGGAKLLFRDISNATNQRTFIGAVCPDWPAGNKTPMLIRSRGDIFALEAVLDSLVFDYILRIRLVSTSLNYYIIEELPLLEPAAAAGLGRLAEALSVQGLAFAPYSDLPPSAWLIQPEARARARAELDARIAIIFGLDEADLAYILSDCDHPAELLSQKAFCRGLDPRGFWRVDRELTPELRQTVRTLRAFTAIKEGAYAPPAAEDFGRAEAAEAAASKLGGKAADSELELIRAHRELIGRIRSFGKEAAPPIAPAAAKKKGEQGFLF